MMLTTARPIVYLSVTDRERALTFYRDIVGLGVTDSDAYGDMLDASGTGVRLTVIADQVPSAHPVFGWAVDDLARAVAELKARGVTMLIYDGFGQDVDGIWAAPDGTTQLAWFNDPDGNVLMLSEG